VCLNSTGLINIHNFYFQHILLLRTHGTVSVAAPRTSRTLTVAWTPELYVGSNLTRDMDVLLCYIILCRQMP
jgi:hypothetical protein